MTNLRIPCLYGDVYDSDLLEELPLDSLKMAISTVPDFETNSLLIENIKMVNPDAVIIVRAHQVEEALKLYQQGASYVLTPHFIGGEHVSHMLEEDKISSKEYEKKKREHIKMLKDVKAHGLEEKHSKKD